MPKVIWNCIGKTEQAVSAIADHFKRIDFVSTFPICPQFLCISRPILSKKEIYILSVQCSFMLVLMESLPVKDPLCISTVLQQNMESYVITLVLTGILVGIHCNEQCISNVTSGKNATSETAFLPWAGHLLTHKRVNFGEKVLTDFLALIFMPCCLQSCLVF